ncbi:hypothetical protein ACJRO7_031019 [Eucalyptus globulus]|uniref:TIR domain-containing protein n=1 Tax=Eucalyptus globulus TaxID=34317 RepID=A0ABD3JGR5_EUCGL
MALQLWEILKESIVAFTGLSPETFFTVLALGLAGLFGSLRDRHQRPRDYQEQMQPLPPPVQLVETSEDKLKQYDGTDPKKSLLANRGQIYDVSQRRRSYDVFLSFRGTDVRNSFLSHLYIALVQSGINTYMDNEDLKKGEQISTALMEAIEESQIAIVVFSKNYASSLWCLEEVAKIMECKEQRGLMVFPVFYKVEPREVRRQRQDYVYTEAMAKHEVKFGKDSEKVKRWKKALLDAGSLSGWPFMDGTSEAKIIEDIVKKISELKMYDVFLSFRGEDVREYFVNSLNEALVQKGIKTFMDSKNLQKGQDFPSKLKEAIEQSRMYIVVFSENYAESWWCLKELVQIQGEKNRTKQLLPIFYKVAPREVRGQNPQEVSGKKQSYEKALTDHESEFGKRKVKKWKEALSKAANVNGIHLHDGNMSGCIARIVKEMEKMMQRIE